MFYIYYGYVDADHHSAAEDPCYKIAECSTAVGVAEFKKEFEEDFIHDDCGNVIFRVFEGKERHLKPKEVVTEYVLE